MKSLRIFIALLLCISALHSKEVKRFAVAVGSNFGDGERVPLRYATTDARTFMEVIKHIGGVDDENDLVLKEPTLEEFRTALNRVNEKIVKAHDEGIKTEFILYYSGHADDKGLLLGKEVFGYQALRKSIYEMKSDVKIAVLDACASGSITRYKGGKKRKPFLVDESVDMKGYAFITSSSGDEVSQESDRISGSFFTHYLVSGLRGAADISGDGRVTLSEAYQFAFNETLANTEKTSGGAQHANYDMNLTGTGDVVFTDVRKTESGLMLGENISGRVFIRNTEGHLIAELYKQAGRSIELGLEPGKYSLRLQKKDQMSESSVIIAPKKRMVVNDRDFKATAVDQTVYRGAVPDVSDTEDSTDHQQKDVQNKARSSLFALYNEVQEKHDGHMVSLGMNRAEAGVDGSQISGGLNLNKGPLGGVQIAGIANIADSVGWMQASGFFNRAKYVKGFQATGFVNLAQTVVGFQASGGVNVADTVLGSQISEFNIADEIIGFQGALLGNIADTVIGFQASSMFNMTDVVSGSQATLFLNVADVVGGVQVGLVNIADSSDYSIGLINIVSNGQIHIAYWYDETAAENISFTTGGGRIYSHVAVSDKVKSTSESGFLGVGFGYRANISELDFNIDYTLYVDVASIEEFIEPNLLNRIKITLGTPRLWRFSAFAGMSYNGLIVNDQDKSRLEPQLWNAKVIDTGKMQINLWPGLIAGIRFHFI